MRNQLSINLSVGRSCFVQCTGCYNYFGKNKENISTPTILNFLAYAKKMGLQKVTLCGGDPLSRSDIVNLLEQIKGLGFFINLDTVGTPLLGSARTIFFGRQEVEAINPKTLASLVDLLGIPIDGSTNEVVSVFRSNRQNLLDEQLQILRLLNNNGAKICLNTVVHKQNIHDLINVPQLMRGFDNIVKWQFFQYMPIGPLGYKSREKFLVLDSDFQTFANNMPKHLHAQGFIGDAEFKFRGGRKGNYLLIDSDGLAWAPQFSQGNSWNEKYDANDNRIILGNINVETSYPQIFEAILQPEAILKRI